MFVLSSQHVTWPFFGAKDNFYCCLASNVTTFMMSYLWLPDSVFSLHFLILQGEVGGGLSKFSLRGYSEKDALGAPSRSYRKQTE